jgi:hypothetical protein
LLVESLPGELRVELPVSWLFALVHSRLFVAYVSAASAPL